MSKSQTTVIVGTYVQKDTGKMCGKAYCYFIFSDLLLPDLDLDLFEHELGIHLS